MMLLQQTVQVARGRRRMETRITRIVDQWALVGCTAGSNESPILEQLGGWEPQGSSRVVGNHAAYSPMLVFLWETIQASVRVEKLK